MDTLLLQLAAPMQSWGVQSLHGERDSGLEPSKSGVIGLVCAALGRDRNKDVSDLAALRMGVRVDREGRLRHDFQKAEPLDTTGRVIGKVTIGNRYYLADAAFLVGLEGTVETLEMVQQALRQPVYSLYLGRKAFPPSKPVFLDDGLQRGTELLEALQAYPAVVRGSSTRRRVMIEDPSGELSVHDQPISFAARRFAPRRVHMDYLVFHEEAGCTSPN